MRGVTGRASSDVKRYLRNNASNLLVRPFYLAWRQRSLRRRLGRSGTVTQKLLYGNTYFSQWGEDVILAELFRREERGCYVDVGCFDPRLISNTYLLYLRGWRGLNIDPNARVIRRFDRARPDDTNLQVAVSTTRGQVPFRFDGAYSGIVPQRSAGQRLGPVEWVDAYPLRDLLEAYLPEADIDLLDVDCEGHDLEVLRSNDWDVFRPRVVLVEVQSIELERGIRAFMRSNGYHLLIGMKNSRVFVVNT